MKLKNEICYSSEFKKDLKRLLKRKADMSKLEKAIDYLVHDIVLPVQY